MPAGGPRRRGLVSPCAGPQTRGLGYDRDGKLVTWLRCSSTPNEFLSAITPGGYKDQRCRESDDEKLAW